MDMKESRRQARAGPRGDDWRAGGVQVGGDAGDAGDAGAGVVDQRLLMRGSTAADGGHGHVGTAEGMASNGEGEDDVGHGGNDALAMGAMGVVVSL